MVSWYRGGTGFLRFEDFCSTELFFGELEVGELAVSIFGGGLKRGLYANPDFFIGKPPP
jgi:hypothetical protein